MPTLTDEIKTFIVKGLACFDPPSAVAQSVKETFGVTVTRRHVHAYDPRCKQPPALRWRELHAATRAAFLRDRAAIGVAHRNVRLRLLDRMVQKAEERNQHMLVAALLKMAAMETGGMFERAYPALDAADPLAPERR